MAKRLIPRSGNSAQHLTYNGAAAELTVNTDTRSVVIHDGVTPGGYDFKRSLASADSVEVVGGRSVTGIVSDIEDLKVADGTIVQNATALALQHLNVHNHSPAAHPELSTFISREADRASIAADAAELSAGIYDTVELGIAAGVPYFSTVSAESAEFLILWKNTGGVAVEQKRYPNTTAINDLKLLVGSFSEIKHSVAGAINLGGYGDSSFTTYLRTAAGNPAEMYSFRENAEFYFTGLVDSPLVAGVTYFNSNLVKLGHECVGNFNYVDFKLTPPRDTALITVCAKNVAPRLTYKEWVNVGKKAYEKFLDVEQTLSEITTLPPPAQGVGAFVRNKSQAGNTGILIVDATATSYFRNSNLQNVNMYRIEPDHTYFYTGVIDDPRYVGVAYFSGTVLLGCECDEVGEYERYRLTPPANATHFSTCSKNSLAVVESSHYTTDNVVAKLTDLDRRLGDLQSAFAPIENTSYEFSKLNATFTNGRITRTGGYDGIAGYQRTSVTNPNTFNVIPGTYDYFYSGEIDGGNYVGVVFLSAEFAVLGFAFDVAGVYTQARFTVPEGTAYIGAHSKLIRPTIEIKALKKTGSSTVYVDSNYIEGGSDGSKLKPYTTINLALNAIKGGGDIEVAGGIYRETLQIAGLTSGKYHIYQREGERVRILGSNKLQNFTIHQANVYKASWAGGIPEYNRLGGRLIFEDGRSSFQITDPHHPLQKSMSHRLPFTPIKPVGSIAEVADTPGSYYHENGIVYLHTSDSSNPAVNGYSYEIPVRTANTFVRAVDQTAVITLQMKGLQFFYTTVGFVACGLTINKRYSCVSLGANGNGAFRNDGGYVETWFEESGFCNNDGENSHWDVGYPGFATLTDNRSSYPTVVYNYLWSHDNGDDGESSHETHNVVLNSCLLEWNGDSGTRPASDATYFISDCLARRNGWEVTNNWTVSGVFGGEGFAAVNPIRSSSRLGCRVFISNCISEYNNIGYQAGSSGATGGHVVELNNCVSRHNVQSELAASAGGKIIARNCRVSNPNVAKHKVAGSGGTITVINDDLLV